MPSRKSVSLPYPASSQHDLGFDPGREGGTELVECDLRLGLEDDIVRHARLGAPVRVISPLMRQIQAIGDRQAGVIVGSRQAHRDLAIVLLAELPAILPRHADRVLALLRDAGVVDDQRPDRAAPLDDGQDTGAHRREAPLIGPFGLRHEVMQRLMRRLHAPRLHARRHRLDALAIARQQQSRAIRSERRRAIGMAQRRRDRLDIGDKP